MSLTHVYSDVKFKLTKKDDAIMLWKRRKIEHHTLAR